MILNSILCYTVLFYVLVSSSSSSPLLHAYSLNITVESRLLDVDHRNLISLTGSPGGGGLQQPVNTNAPPPMSITQTQHQKPGLLPTPPAISALWQQPPPQGINTIGGGGNNNVDSDFRTNYMQSQGIPPPPMPPVMGNYYGNPGNVSREWVAELTGCGY